MSQPPLPLFLRALEVEPPAQHTGYPEPFAARVAGRIKRRLGDAFGLSNYGVNLCQLKPGSESSMRHAHSAQDEFVYILEGTATLITNAGASTLDAGMCAGFKAGTGDAHQLRNDGEADVWFLEIGDRSADDKVIYPDDDLALQGHGAQRVFTHKNGVPYPRAK